MQSKATTVDQYLDELPQDRRLALAAVRKVILENLDEGFEEGMVYGMIGYYVPHSVYPAGYHCDPSQPVCFAGLSSQKNYMSLYLMCVYGNEKHARWFQEAWAKTGKKLDMGKACIRFKKLDDLPLNVIGQAIKRVSAKKYIEHYEAALKTMKGRTSKGPSKSAAPARAKTARSAKATKAPRKSSRTATR